MTKKKRGDANYGIQAGKVTAGALAVGTGARATQHMHATVDSAKLAAALAELKTVLAGSPLPSYARTAVEADAAAIAAEGEKVDPDPERLEALLKGLAEKVKLAGQFAEGAAALIEPLKKIAAAVGLRVLVAGLF